jgi:hypothetical protein
LSYPRCVGVDDLAEQQLGADGDDFCVHVLRRFLRLELVAMCWLQRSGE